MILLLIAVLVLPVAPAAARAEEPLDWSAWQAMPVLDGGRIMPLDTFARSVVEEICGRANPRLSPAEVTADGASRRFTAAELLFSWLVEPERWDNTPFLAAGNEQLREDILDLPVRDREGNRLKYVSPRQFEDSRRADARLGELAESQRKAEAEGTKFEVAGADEALARLNEAYGTYRILTFNPAAPAVRRTRFLDRLYEVVTTWRQEIEPSVRPWRGLDKDDPLGKAVDQSARAIDELVEVLRKESFTLSDAEPPASRLCDATVSLAREVAAARDRAFDTTAGAGGQPLADARATINALGSRVKRLALQARSLRMALYDNGRSLRVLPALNPWALERGRDPGEDLQPWLNLQTLLLGSPEVLKGYPADKVAEVREAFAAAKTAYLDRDAADRPARFAAAMDRFVASVRSLGEGIESARRRLPIEHKDEALLAATAYPPTGSTANELRYNRLDPFRWSWVVTLASIVCFALGFGVLRKPMFWLGAVVLATAQGFTLYGLGLRAAITGMVPVTNMFETVLFVGATVALLGLWFGLLPLLWPGLGAAWRLTAVPTTWESPREEDAAGWSVARVLLLAVRAVLVGVVFYCLAIGSYSPAGDGAVLNLIPRSASTGVMAWLNSIVLWLVGLALLAWAMWFVPRAVPAVLLSIVLVPVALAREGISGPAQRAVARKPFVLAGAAVALLAYLVAYFAPGPVFQRDVGLQMAAVLRNNFWLAIHVLIITASYGAGALAWGLGNLSLAYYAFGRYRDPVAPSEDLLAAGHRPPEGYQPPPPRRRPPEPCSKLAAYIYKATQVAVLLLAAGTITGAIWADFAWGRYWGWDPKEVWALVSLLVYLAVLHGRWAGWAGNFGLAVGSVLGATAIMIAWYGVNFVLKGGLHSYGTGAGGQIPVGICVAANWLLVLFAAVRYALESKPRNTNCH
jgi:ABC-type transport system involved in cytochrome c biogenesis permease subunit